MPASAAEAHLFEKSRRFIISPFDRFRKAARQQRAPTVTVADYSLVRLWLTPRAYDCHPMLAVPAQSAPANGPELTTKLYGFKPIVSTHMLTIDRSLQSIWMKLLES